MVKAYIVDKSFSRIIEQDRDEDHVFDMNVEFPDIDSAKKALVSMLIEDIEKIRGIIENE